MIDQKNDIRIRPCIPEDYPKIYKWLFYSDIPCFNNLIREEYDCTIPAPEVFREDYQPYFFDGTAPEKGRSYMILCDHQEAGHISYTSFHLLEGIAELDIWLAGEKFSKKGIGPEAIRKLSHHLFQNNFHTVFMRPATVNSSAIKAYQKAGLKIIVPDYSQFYRKDFLELYSDGDLGEGNDVFMVCTKKNRVQP